MGWVGVGRVGVGESWWGEGLVEKRVGGEKVWCGGGLVLIPYAMNSDIPFFKMVTLVV